MTMPSLGFADGTTLQFQDTARLTDFLYAVAAQKSQATNFVTDTFRQDIAWLDQVDQPMLNVAQNLEDLAAYNAARNATDQATLAHAAARIALRIAAEAPGTRGQLTEKVSLPGHQTQITVFANTLDPFGGATYHDVDPGILGILETVGVVIINVAGVAFPGSPFTYAAIAVDLAEAGKAFSNGQILQGVLSLAAAAGIGSEVLGYTNTSQVINIAAEGVGGVYGAVQSAQNGDALGVVAGVLEAAAAAASGYAASTDTSSPFDGAGGEIGPDGSIVPDPSVTTNPFTGLPDPGLKDFATTVSDYLAKGSVALSLSDAFSQGNLAGGLVSSLSAVLQNLAASYASEENAVIDDVFEDAGIDPGTYNPSTNPNRVPFGLDELDDGRYEIAGDITSSRNIIGRAKALIGVDAHSTLARFNFDNPKIGYNITLNKLFGVTDGGKLRPDFIINKNDGSPIELIELKPAGQESLGSRQLQTYLDKANKGAPIDHLRAVAGNPTDLFNSNPGTVLSARTLFNGSTYSYSASGVPGVATYTTSNEQGAVGAAMQYLLKNSPSSPTVVPSARLFPGIG